MQMVCIHSESILLMTLIQLHEMTVRRVTNQNRALMGAVQRDSSMTAREAVIQDSDCLCFPAREFQ